MGQFDHLHAFAGRIGEVERTLRSGEGFFDGRAQEYLTLAIEVARSTLAGLRPAGVEPATWDLRIRAISGAIGCALISSKTLRLHVEDPSSNTDSNGLVLDLPELTSQCPEVEIMAAIASAWEEAFQERVGRDLMDWVQAEFSRVFEVSPPDDG